MELVISPELESELMETLAAKFGWAQDRINEALVRVYSFAFRVQPQPLTGIVRDSDDDHVIAAALESGAKLIVTGIEIF